MIAPETDISPAPPIQNNNVRDRGPERGRGRGTGSRDNDGRRGRGQGRGQDRGRGGFRNERGGDFASRGRGQARGQGRERGRGAGNPPPATPVDSGW
jgi:hypothetical protein